uniref:Rho GTPase activating protein n=1 Tax=Philodina roseola TaxID=96448 RepID=B2ZFA3_PHIRO|nr:Rho GTPase activating protein [Philodina roseola]
MIFTGSVVVVSERVFLSNESRMSAFHQGWLKVRYDGQMKWTRRFSLIDWDKALLFLSTKIDGNFTDWIKLLPTNFINEILGETPMIEIRVDRDKYFLQAEDKNEHDAWLLALKRTAFSRVGGGIFGQSLEETFKYSLDKTSLVPSIVRQCCEFLLEFGSAFVGLFRVPGKQSAIKELREKFDRGVEIDLNSAGFSPATISSLLKIYLQSLPSPIIPMNFFDEFLQIGSKLKYNENDDLDKLKNLIENSLNDVHFAVLSYLCQFLKKLTEFENQTKMDVENLALTFGNNLIRSNEESDLNMIKGHNFNLLPLIKVLINQCDFLFAVKDQHNQSMTKSSGFSSFSSLLSTHEQILIVPSRSSSMPSIRCETHSSSDDSPIEQSFVNCLDDDNIRQTNRNENEHVSSKKQRQSSKSKIIDEDLFLFIYKMISTGDASSSLKKKFGKSLSHLKSTVSKAFQSSTDSTLTTKQLATDQIDLINELIEEKNLILNELTRSSEEQRQHFQDEKSQLNQIIEQLEKENLQLKSKLSSQ